MSSLVEISQPGLYIGGLRNDLHPAKLAALICNLLSKFKVQVAKQRVHITFKSSEAYAIVELPDIPVSYFLLMQLDSPANVHNVYDLFKITFDPTNFKVGPNLTTSSRHRSRSRLNKKANPARSGLGVASEPNSRKCSPSNNYSTRFRSQSGSITRRSSMDGGPLTQTRSNTLLLSASNHSADDGASMSRRARSKARRQKNQAQINGRANENHCIIHTANHTPSKTSLKSLSLTALPLDHTGLAADSDADLSPISKDVSSSSLSSRDSEDAGFSSRENLYHSRKLAAGGVQRLVQEEIGRGVDPTSRSFSDRGIHASSAVVGKTSAATSMTGLPQPSKVSVTTSTPGTGAGLTCNFYRLGQTVGRETRHSEFKQGGKAHTRSWLMETVGKYICGFLNSGEGGTLYIGVNDSGAATGISCPQSKEDEYRLLIDDAFKNIDPPIFPNIYSVRFIPLMEPSGHISDNLQVLEVEVKEVKKLCHLYVFRGNAFLRRDGSLQGPLKARHVQEWTREQLEQNSSRTLLNSQLQEMTTQLEQEREMSTCLRQRLLELENHLSEMGQTMERYHQTPGCSNSEE